MNVVRLLGDHGAHTDLPWTKEWPPPLELCAVGSRAMPGRLHALAYREGVEDIRRGLVEEGEDRTIEEIYTLDWYDQVSCSALPDDVADHPHVARVAVYQLRT